MNDDATYFTLTVFIIFVFYFYTKYGELPANFASFFSPVFAYVYVSAKVSMGTSYVFCFHLLLLIIHLAIKSR
jgi:hypothetical protein